MTAAQIERARSALAAGEEPWKSAWAKVLARAQQGLGEAPSAVADLSRSRLLRGRGGPRRGEEAPARRRQRRLQLRAGPPDRLRARRRDPRALRREGPRADRRLGAHQPLRLRYRRSPRDGLCRHRVRDRGGAARRRSRLERDRPRALHAVDRYGAASTWRRSSRARTTGRAGACSRDSPARTGATTQRRSRSTPRGCGR